MLENPQERAERGKREEGAVQILPKTPIVTISSKSPVWGL